MKKLMLSACLFMPLALLASPKDMMLLMDSLCMGTDGEIPVIEKMVIARGGKAIDEKITNLDQAAARNGGKGFLLAINKQKYVVMATNTGGCSVLAQGISAPELKKLIGENYPVFPPYEDASGAQNLTLWKVKPASRYQGGAIMLNSAKEGFGVDGTVTLGFVPEKLMNKK